MPLIGPFEYGRTPTGAPFFRWAADNPLNPFLGDVAQAISCPDCAIFSVPATPGRFVTLPGEIYGVIGGSPQTKPREGYSFIAMVTPEHAL